jgi:glycerol kinase
MQTQADLLGLDVERPSNIESTALGAAMLAGLGIGQWHSPEALSQTRRIDKHFPSTITAKIRRERLRVWKRAVRRARNWEKTL